MAEPVATAAAPLRIALVGNPNTGKTTLFNALTGLRQRVGNYPGVTVEIKTGKATAPGRDFEITDVPGSYSLSPRSPDELLAVELLLGMRPGTPQPQAVICVLDASNLERNLYLASQVLELGLPTVLALNMTDVAAARGVEFDVAELSKRFGVSVIPIQANAGKGLTELCAAAAIAIHSPTGSGPEFPPEFTKAVGELRDWLAKAGDGATPKYLLERAILDSGGQIETRLAERFGAPVRDLLEKMRADLTTAGHPPVSLEPKVRYRWIGARVAGAVKKPAVARTNWSDKLDKVLLHRFWGVVVFILLMGIVFEAIFHGAEYPMGAIESALGAAGKYVGDFLPEGALRSLVVDGAFAGVAAVLVFLPQIVILFGFLAILEDCGYMARAAFLMDKLLSRAGLSGKSFIPMLSSFACAIPGVMATRTIEDRRDRLVTILVAPLMSCSARLPVYTLLIAAFIPAGAVLEGNWNLFGRTMEFHLVEFKTLTMLAMYMIGLIVAPLVAWSLKKTVLKGEPPVFLMELPAYKLPSILTVLHRMVDRGWAFVRRAGTLILASSVLIWALGYYPRPQSVADSFAPREEAVKELAAKHGEKSTEAADAQAQLDRDLASAYQAQSYLGRMGKSIEPVVRPLGWDWKIGMAAIASFPAREVVVAALGTIYSVGAEDLDDEGSERRAALVDAMKAERRPDGSKVFNVPTALSIMVFFALCCQCVGTLAAIWRETRSLGWTVFTFVYMTTLAYFAALVTYQIGIRWGTGG